MLASMHNGYYMYCCNLEIVEADRFGKLSIDPFSFSHPSQEQALVTYPVNLPTNLIYFFPS